MSRARQARDWQIKLRQIRPVIASSRENGVDVDELFGQLGGRWYCTVCMAGIWASLG